MNFKIMYYSLLMLLLSSSAACRDEQRWIKGEGNNVSNTRMPEPFTGISLSMDADVEVYRDSVFRIELTGQQNILNVLETKVSGSTLSISYSWRTTVRRHNPVTIRIYMPVVSNIDISGSGSIACRDGFDVETLHTNVSGSGNITYDGAVRNSFHANVSGSGSITNNGNNACRSASFTISGSGNIYAEWLRAEDADAHVSGSGDQRIHATRSLDAHISGSGDILYRGRPAVNSHISGSGKVIAIQ